jgi:hypothetical protein
MEKFVFVYSPVYMDAAGNKISEEKLPEFIRSTAPIEENQFVPIIFKEGESKTFKVRHVVHPVDANSGLAIAIIELELSAFNYIV